MDVYANRHCKFPPPCNTGMQQFKLKGNGPPCCRKMNHDVGCPVGKFKCPITGHCVRKNFLKKCGSHAEFKKQIEELVNTHGVDVGGKKNLPSYMKLLRGVGGKNRTDRMSRVKMVLDVCKAANVPLLTYNGKFKKWPTLIGECKARFRVPKGGPSAVPPETVASVAAAGNVSLTEPLLPNAAGPAPSTPPLDAGSYTPPPFVAFGRQSGFGYSDFGNFNFGRYSFGKKKIGPSPCKGMDQAACGGNPNCHYTKRGCASKRSTRKTGKSKVVYQGPMGPPAFGRYSFGKKKISTGPSPCKGMDQAACGGNPNCHYTKRGCASKRSTRKTGKSKVVYEGPSGPPAFGRRKPPSALLKRCKKHGIKTTVKRGKHRVYRKTSILKKLLARKMKKVKKVKKLSKRFLSKCRKYHVKTTIKRGKHRVQKTLAVIKRQLRAKGCKRV